MSLAEPIITLLAHFQSAFTNPTWQKKYCLTVVVWFFSQKSLD